MEEVPKPIIGYPEITVNVSWENFFEKVQLCLVARLRKQVQPGQEIRLVVGVPSIVRKKTLYDRLLEKIGADPGLVVTATATLILGIGTLYFVNLCK